MMTLRISSFNCCSLRKNIDIVRELITYDVDIILLQETFVTANNISILNYIDENYFACGNGAVYSDRAIESFSGRPKGGFCYIMEEIL